MIKEGSPIPLYTLKDENGGLRAIRDFHGRWLVLFIYPEDDTPNCTREAKCFTSSLDQFERLGASVAGLSHNEPASHRSFAEKHDLGVHLLSDPGGHFLRSLGIPQMEWNGRLYWARTTLIIDPEGRVRRILSNLEPEAHVSEALQAICSLLSPGAAGRTLPTDSL